MKLTLFLSALLIILAPVSRAKSSGAELETEYEQVRRIALKDPKVRAAFDRANDKLNEKILEIDPALKPMVERKGAAKPKSATAAKPAPTKVSETLGEKTYVVVKGDTLTSIAARFGVSVSDLKTTNSIADEHKLRIGQTLRIPKALSSAQATTKKDDSWWSRVKSSF